MELEKEVLMQKIASLVAVGMHPADMAKSIGVTPQKIRYYMNQPYCRDLTLKIINESLADVIKKAKKDMSQLVPKAIRALEKKIDDESDLKAVELVLKGVGVYKEEEKQEQATAIQIIMPGQDTKETIVVQDDEIQN